MSVGLGAGVAMGQTMMAAMQQPQAPSQQSGARFCTDCGKPVSAGAHFCPDCGKAQ